MKPSIRTALLAACLAPLAHPALAHEFKVGELEIGHPWASAPPPGAPSVAGYLTITNDGDAPDVLLGATMDFAAAVEMHETRISDGVASMRALADGIEIDPGETVRLEPNGAHLMFVSPTRQLKVGERPSVELEFRDAGTVEVQFAIEDGVPEGMQGEAMNQDEMDHGTMDHGEPGDDEMDHGK